MGKEACWLYAPCVISVLKYLVIMPRTPMQLRAKTRIRGNYANLILKRLESEGFVKCLTFHERIGKVFCINPANTGRVEKILKESGYNLKARVLPELNWKAYGRLTCNSCKQLKKIFSKAVKLNSLGINITEPNLEIELRDNGILEMNRSDIYRALRHLKRLGLIVSIKKKRKHMEYELTSEARAIAEFIRPLI